MYPANPGAQAHQEKLASGHRIIAHLVANGEDPLAFTQLVKVANTDPSILAFADDVAYALYHALEHDVAAGQKVAGIMNRVRAVAAAPLGGFLAGHTMAMVYPNRGFFGSMRALANDLSTDVELGDLHRVVPALPGVVAGLVAGYHPVAATGAGIAGLGALAAGGAVAHRKYDEAHPFGATMRNFGF